MIVASPLRKIWTFFSIFPLDTGEIHDALPIRMELIWNRPMPATVSIRTSIFFSAVFTSLSYEADEAPGLFAVSKGYFMDAIREHNALQSAYGETHLLSINQRQLYLVVY